MPIDYKFASLWNDGDRHFSGIIPQLCARHRRFVYHIIGILRYFGDPGVPQDGRTIAQDWDDFLRIIYTGCCEISHSVGMADRAEIWHSGR